MIRWPLSGISSRYKSQSRGSRINTRHGLTERMSLAVLLFSHVKCSSFHNTQRMTFYDPINNPNSIYMNTGRCMHASMMRWAAIRDETPRLRQGHGADLLYRVRVLLDWRGVALTLLVLWYCHRYATHYYYYYNNNNNNTTIKIIGSLLLLSWNSHGSTLASSCIVLCVLSTSWKTLQSTYIIRHEMHFHYTRIQ